MKKTALAIIACVAVAGSAFAGTSYVSGKDMKTFKEPVPPAPTCFADEEFQFDLFGTYTFTMGSQYHDNAGGGIALNYFFARYVGVGADTDIYSGGANGVWNYTGRLILRYPIDSICTAPYIFGGGGYQADGEGEGTVHAGLGLEYRVVPHRIGLFVEGRYTWADRNEATETRAGIRIVF